MKYKITFSTGESEVHFANPGQADIALCGHDLDGDDHFGTQYERAKITKDKVDCQHCISIVKYCKSISNKEIKP